MGTANQTLKGLTEKDVSKSIYCVVLDASRLGMTREHLRHAEEARNRGKETLAVFAWCFQESIRTWCRVSIPASRCA